MKGCELCPNNNNNNNNNTAAVEVVAASVYCESDEASLCFECDAKVHGANFLVARHSRVLLCHRCQSPTPWRAEGRRLGPTFSLCDRCFLLGSRSRKSSSEGDDDDDDQDQESEEDDNEEEEDESEEEEEEEGEEQVVPGTKGASPAPPPPTPPAASSSSSEGEEVAAASGMLGRNGFLLKRRRGNFLLDLPCYSTSDKCQVPCSSPSWASYIPDRTAFRNSIGTVADEEAASDSFRPVKDRKVSDLIRSGSHQLSFDTTPFSAVRPPL